MSRNVDRKTDVVIVGAGLAGLSAAIRLRDLDREVLVLEEAAEQVGGRTRSVTVDGQSVDLGGELVSGGYRHTPELVRSLRLTLEPTGLWHARVRRDAELRLRPSQAAALARALWAMGRSAHRMPTARPWDSPRAQELDRVSVGQWLREYGVRGAGYRQAEAIGGTFMGAPLEELSLLHALWWIRSDGGPLRALLRAGRWRVREGAQEISRRLAARLGDSLRTGERVVRIEQGAGRVRVVAASGQSYEGRRAIICVSLPATGAIEFDPPLPRPQAAVSALGVARLAKVVVVVKREARLPAHRLAIGGGRLAVGWRHGRRLESFARGNDASAPEQELAAELRASFGLAEHEITWRGKVDWSESRESAAPTRRRRPGS